MKQEIPTDPNRVSDPDSTANNTIRDVIGNKEDAAITTVGTVNPLMALIKGILNQVNSIIADRYIVNPKNTTYVDVDNVAHAEIVVVDTDTGLVSSDNITAGTYDLIRVRAGAETTITSGVSWSKATGQLYDDITMGNANWQIDDLYKIVDQGDSKITIDGTDYFLPIPTMTGYVGDLSGIEDKIDTIDSNIDTINTNVDQSLSTTEDNIRGTDNRDMTDVYDNQVTPNSLAESTRAAQDITTENEITSGDRYRPSTDEYLRVRFTLKDVNQTSAGCTITVRITRIDDPDGTPVTYEVWNEDIDVSSGETNIDRTSSGSFLGKSGDDYAVYVTSDDAADTSVDEYCEFLKSSA